jgi:4-amino-4-deoxy-L-arabinose transferase-like glycosyltransferase
MNEPARQEHRSALAAASGRRPGALMIAVAIAAAVVVLAQGASAPFEKDAEPQSAEWIISVVRDGHWLIPRDFYGEIDRKPPLYYWLSAIATRISGRGVDEVRARTVSIIAATALAAEILVWTAAEIGAAEGWLAFLFLLGTYGFASRATLALTDMLLLFLMMSAYLILYRIVEPARTAGDPANGRNELPRALAAGAVIGLAILTKGPIALILVGLAIFIFLLMRGQNPLGRLRESWPWLTAAVAIAMAACWYVPWLMTGGPHVRRIFVEENFGHFLPRRFGGTGEAARPVWYFIARLIGGSLPLMVLMPAAAAGFARDGFAERKRAPLLYQASFLLAVILFFSAASAKRDDYILPALPGVAILCAAMFALEPRARHSRARWAPRLRDWAVVGIGAAMLAMTAGAILIACARIALPIKLQSSDADFMALFLGGIAEWRPAFVILEIAIAAGALIALWAGARRRPLAAGLAVGALSLCGSVFFNAVLRPELASRRSLGSFAGEIHARIGGAPLYVVRGDNFELSYYYGRGVPALFGRNAPPLPAGAPAYIMVYPKELKTIAPDIRERMTRIMASHVIGGNGPPALYEIAPARLNVAGQTDR